MDATPFLERVLEDEGLTSDLDEAEAMALVQAVCARVRAITAGAHDPATASRQVDALCQTARGIAREAGASRRPGATLQALLPKLHGAS